MGSWELSLSRRATQRTVIQIECRDRIGHAFRNRDFCEAYAQPIIKRAELRAIPISWRSNTTSDVVADS